jgi:hypothetical protein
MAIFGCFQMGDDHQLCGARIPWRRVDGALLWNSTDQTDVPPWEQEQGAAALRYRDGWSCLAWWDRSGDARYGSNTALFAHGIHSFRSMLELLAQHYPQVESRQPVPLYLKLAERPPHGAP